MKKFMFAANIFFIVLDVILMFFLIAYTIKNTFTLLTALIMIVLILIIVHSAFELTKNKG